MDNNATALPKHVSNINFNTWVQKYSPVTVGIVTNDIPKETLFINREDIANRIASTVSMHHLEASSKQDPPNDEIDRTLFMWTCIARGDRYFIVNGVKRVFAVDYCVSTIPWGKDIDSEEIMIEVRREDVN